MSNSAGKQTGNQTQKENDKKRSIAEWVTLTISSIIILLIIGLLAYQYLVKQDKPAVIVTRIQTNKIRNEKGNYYLPVDVYNSGGRTVEDLKILIKYTGKNETESYEFSIQFLAGGEKQTAVAVFSKDPKNGTITTDVLGYLTP